MNDTYDYQEERRQSSVIAAIHTQQLLLQDLDAYGSFRKKDNMLVGACAEIIRLANLALFEMSLLDGHTETERELDAMKKISCVVSAFKNVLLSRKEREEEEAKRAEAEAPSVSPVKTEEEEEVL